MKWEEFEPERLSPRGDLKMTTPKNQQLGWPNARVESPNGKMGGGGGMGTCMLLKCHTQLRPGELFRADVPIGLDVLEVGHSTCP